MFRTGVSLARRFRTGLSKRRPRGAIRSESDVSVARCGSAGRGLVLDDRLVDEAVKVGNHRTKKEAVTAALKEYVQPRKQQEILDLVGKVDYYEDYDPTRLRSRKVR